MHYIKSHFTDYISKFLLKATESQKMIPGCPFNMHVSPKNSSLEPQSLIQPNAIHLFWTISRCMISYWAHCTMKVTAYGRREVNERAACCLTPRWSEKQSRKWLIPPLMAWLHLPMRNWFLKLTLFSADDLLHRETVGNSSSFQF